MMRAYWLTWSVLILGAFATCQAAPITADYTGGPDTVGSVDFSLLFPGASTLGLAIDRLELSFVFQDDEEGSEAESYGISFIDDGTAHGLAIGIVNNWPVEGGNPLTFVNLTIRPGDTLLYGGTGAYLLGYITNGSDDLDINVTALTGDFQVVSAHGELYTVPEPVSLGTGCFGHPSPKQAPDLIVTRGSSTECTRVLRPVVFTN
jgi:hypothetical protein